MEDPQNELLKNKQLLEKLNAEVQKFGPISSMLDYLDKKGCKLNVGINKRTWVSHARNEYFNNNRIDITLGVQNIPADMKKRLFPFKEISDEDTRIYRYIHELSHIADFLALSNWETGMMRGDLLLLIEEKRKNERLGFSTLGNLSTYTEKKDDNSTPTEEDLAELIAMRIFDQQYYKDYLEMLKSEQSGKKELGLVTLNEYEVMLVDQYIESAVKYISEINKKPIEQRPAKLTRIY
jgi:hypothetical protein